MGTRPYMEKNATLECSLNCNVYVFYRVGSGGKVPLGGNDTREIEPRQQKSQNMTSYKIKRHPTTVDNVSTFYCLNWPCACLLELLFGISLEEIYY